MDIEIRKAAPSEAVLVSDVLTEAALWLRARGAELWSSDSVSLSRVAPEVEEGLYFLAWSGAASVGAMRLTWTDPFYWPEAVPGEALYVHRLAVRRAFAGGRASSALLVWAAAHAQAHGARFLRLDCQAPRAALRRVYERFGFALHSERALGSSVVARYQLTCCQDRP
jgi:GNAT superfamily N-acetyltransferase